MQPFNIPESATFADLLEDHVLFTHAAAILYGQLPFDLLSQARDEGNLKDLKLKILAFDEPVFDGLATLDSDMFNKMLFAVDRSQWPDLARTIGSMAIKDTPSQIYYHLTWQKLPMVDYLAIKKKQILSEPFPFVDVYCLAIDGNHACVRFVPAPDPPVGHIRLLYSDPRPEMVEFGRKVLSNQPVSVGDELPAEDSSDS